MRAAGAITQRAIAVHREHPYDPEERHRGHARHDLRRREPALVGQPRRCAEEDDQDREDVVGAFDERSSDDLRQRRLVRWASATTRAASPARAGMSC